MRMSGTKAGRAALGAAAAAGVRHMAHRFIVGETPQRRAEGDPRTCGSNGAAVSLDLLGEATVTQAEADRYAARCLDALETLAGAAPARGRSARCSRRDSLGPAPAREPVREGVRAHAAAAARGARGGPRGRRPAHAAAAACAPRSWAPTCTSTWSRWTRSRRRSGSCSSCSTSPSCATGPRPGVVMQAYLRESPEQLEQVLDWARASRARAAARGAPREGRVLGPRGGGRAPARLDAAGVRGQARVGPQLRGAHAAAARGLAARAARDRLAQPALGGARGGRQRASWGARTATSSSRCCAGSATTSPRRSRTSAMRVRIYCPVGDMVAGMAYLVRRLLENTANESFLGEQQRGTPIEQLLAAP